MEKWVVALSLIFSTVLSLAKSNQGLGWLDGGCAGFQISPSVLISHPGCGLSGRPLGFYPGLDSTIIFGAGFSKVHFQITPEEFESSFHKTPFSFSLLFVGEITNLNAQPYVPLPEFTDEDLKAELYLAAYRGEGLKQKTFPVQNVTRQGSSIRYELPSLKGSVSFGPIYAKNKGAGDKLVGFHVDSGYFKASTFSFGFVVDSDFNRRLQKLYNMAAQGKEGRHYSASVE